MVDFPTLFYNLNFTFLFVALTNFNFENTKVAFGPSLPASQPGGDRLRSLEGGRKPIFCKAWQSFAKLGNLLQSLLCETLRNFGKLFSVSLPSGKEMF